MTEHEAAAALLRESEQRLGLALDAAQAGTWEWDLRTNRNTWSDGLWSLYGLERGTGEASYEIWRASIHPDDRERVEALVAEAARSGTELNAEWRVAAPDGAERWLASRGRPIRDADGGFSRFMGIVFDVTERRRSELALVRSESRFRALTENASDLLIVMDASGNHQFWSRGATELLGWTPEEVLGRPALELMHPDDRPLIQESLGKLLERRGLTSRDVMRVRHKDGSWRHIEATARDLLDDPAVGGIVVNGRDVTVERRLEEQFRQAQKLESVGRLAGGVAHDFNNLLTIIMGCASSLEESLGSRHPDLAGEVREIGIAAKRAADLTGQLLTFARKQLVTPALLDLGETVRGSEKMLRRLLGEDIELRVEGQPGLWTARADHGQFTQVVVNLAVNARDAMPSGGTLTIRTLNATTTPEEAAADPDRMPGEWVRLVVRDSGTGMSAEVKAHLFEPFFTTKEVGKGTGLGLATVYGIVQQAGGHIHVRSEAARGTTFEICLPRVRRGPDVVAPAPDAAPGKGTERVLLVEDDPGVRAVTQRALARAGYEVVSLARPADALALPLEETCRVHLLVTDVVMPGMDGRALARELRLRHPALPVLYLSGYTPDSIQERGLNGPDGAFLAKPFTAADLLTKVRETLDSR